MLLRTASNTQAAEQGRGLSAEGQGRRGLEPSPLGPWPLALGPPLEWHRWFNRRRREASNSHAESCGRNSVRRTEKMARLEAVLYIADGALTTRRLAQYATLADTAEARTLIDRLNAAYDEVDSPFRVERVASGYRLLTRPEYAVWLNRLHHRQTELKLSPPAMEALTIIAYRQPVKRVDVEAIRGVHSAEIIKQLMERGLVRIGGEENSLGRPYLYETTKYFFELFGLRSLDDLPMAETLRTEGQHH